MMLGGALILSIGLVARFVGPAHVILAETKIRNTAIAFQVSEVFELWVVMAGSQLLFGNNGLYIGLRVAWSINSHSYPVVILL